MKKKKYFATILTQTNLLKYLLLSLCFSLLISCDCMQYIHGYVIDAETKEPLDQVYYSRVRLTAQEKRFERNHTLHHNQRLTDSTGWFQDSRLSNGSNCKPHLILWIDKEGYQPIQLVWKREKSNLDTLVVELHKVSF